MKCSKCGRLFKDTQTHCIWCGASLSDAKELNYIEEQLANSVGDMMDEIMNEEKNKSSSFDDYNQYDYDNGNKKEDTLDILKDFKPIQLDDDIEEELKKSEILRSATQNIGNTNVGYTVDSVVALKKNKRKQINEDELKEKKILRAKIVLALMAIVVIIVVAVVLVMVPDNNNLSNRFKTNYNKGMIFYNEGDFDNAVQAYNEAYNCAKDASSQKKVLNSLIDTYSKMPGTDSAKMDVYKKLIDLEPDNVDNYEALLKLYDANGMVNEMDQLVKTVEGTDIAAKLTAYSFMGPEFNYESGTYDQYIYLSLKDDKGYKIYYTMDGTEPTSSSIEYTDVIEINKEGTTVIKAISVNEKGISSSVVTKEFDIKLSTLVPPTVSPDSGTYNAVSQITIDIPAGCTAYYTLGEEASTPTTVSTRYEGPIDMPCGKNVFSAITVNQEGVASSVTQKIFELNVDRAYTYNQALDSLKTNLIASGFILDSEGKTATGGIIEFSYVSAQVMEGNEYYLIKASTGEVFGVGTVTGVIVSVAVNEKGIFEIVN